MAPPIVLGSDVEAEAEVPEAVAFWWKRKKNMPLPLCFKVAVRILVDFCKLEVFFFRFCLMFI
jgi:hypothetical protein